MIQQQSSPPLLSICIPAYNRPEWLKRAVSSILTMSVAQQSQVEIIVSDDSTVPDCQRVVDELMADWQGSWRYQANSPRLGMAANWNRCIQMASGDYVLLLHDDDYLQAKAPDEIIHTLRNNPDVPAFLFGVNVVTPQQKIRKRQVFQSQHDLSSKLAVERVLSNSSLIRFPGIVLKRDAFDTVGYFNETSGGIADIQMWVRICHQYGLVCVPITTANYTVHPHALTMEMFNPEVIKGLEQIFDDVLTKKWLPAKILDRCKANYFHQFVLAGTVRYIKIKNFERAKEVLSLFDSIDIQASQATAKWKVIRAILQFTLLTQNPFTSARQSSEA